MDAQQPKGLTRRQILERAGATGALLTLPGLLSACGSGSSGGGSGAGPIAKLTWGLPTSVAALDVASSFNVTTMTVVSMMLDTLVTYDDRLALQPHLAQSWKAVDEKTYVYMLRTDAQFWDGSPVTAEDVVASFERHTDPKAGSQLASYFGSVRSVEASGPNEVTFKLAQPDNFFQYSPVLVGIMPKAFIQANGKRIGTPRVKVMGSGPYRVKTFSPDEGITMVRNDAWWGPKLAVEQVDLRFVADENARLLAVRSRELSGAYQVPLDKAAQWDAIPGTRSVYAPGLTVQYWSFDLDSEPWNDIHVRRAVAHAVDREGLVNAALGGHGQPAQTVVPPEQWGGLLERDKVDELYASLPSYAFDLDMARAELAMSSVPKGFKTSVQVPTDSQSVLKMALSLKDTLGQIGIQLDVKEVPFDQWIATLFAHKNLGLQLSGYAPDYADPGNYPAIILNSANAAPNAFNTANFKNAEVDRLNQVQLTSGDPAARIDALKRILQIAGEQLPYAPIIFTDTGLVVSDELEYQGLNGLYYFQDLAAKVHRA